MSRKNKKQHNQHRPKIATQKPNKNKTLKDRFDEILCILFFSALIIAGVILPAIHDPISLAFPAYTIFIILFLNKSGKFSEITRNVLFLLGSIFFVAFAYYLALLV